MANKVKFGLVMKPAMVIDHQETSAMAKLMRNSRGLTMAVVAKLMGISPSYVAKLENGDSPNCWTKERALSFEKALNGK